MKRLFTISTILMMTLGLLAQETTVSVLVKEDGKVVKDTTYVYDDAEKADHAVKIMSMISESGDDDKHFKYVMKSEGKSKHASSMVFISEDGEKTHIHGDSVVWKEHGDHDGKHVKVMKVHVDEDDHAKHGKKVIVVSSEDGETFDILLDEDCDHDTDGKKVVKKKEVKVIVNSDEDGTWEVIEKEIEDGDVDVDVDEDAEVIVIKKKQKKSKKQ